MNPNLANAVREINIADAAIAATESAHSNALNEIKRLQDLLDIAKETALADEQKIAELEAEIARLRELLDIDEPVKPPTGVKPYIGLSMSKWARGIAPVHAARCYNHGDVTDALTNHKNELKAIVYSALGVTTVAQATTEINWIKTEAVRLGVPNVEIHFAIANEADRHFTGAGIATFVQNCKTIAPAVNRIANCSFWMNITRDGIRTGEVEAFRVGPNDGIGMAINCYSPGRKESPAEYTDYSVFVPMMFEKCLVPWGIKEYECWEFGTEINGIVPQGSSAPNNRPDYIVGQVRETLKQCEKHGVNFRLICYWNSIKQTGGQPDLTQPDNRLLHDEPRTSRALRDLALEYHPV